MVPILLIPIRTRQPIKLSQPPFLIEVPAEAVIADGIWRDFGLPKMSMIVVDIIGERVFESVVGKLTRAQVAITNRPAHALSRSMHDAPTAVRPRCIRTAASSSRDHMGMPRPLLENARRPPLVSPRQSTTMDVNLDACVPANIPAVKGQKRPCRTHRTEPGIQPFPDLATLDLISFISFY